MICSKLDRREVDVDGRRVRGEETWAAARNAYLGGLAAADVCERFDLGLSALRLRARREGWRRTDQPDPALDLPDEDRCEHDGSEPPGADPPAPAALAAQVWARAAAAVRGGRLREAQGWTKLWRELTAAADAGERARVAQVSAERRAATDDACDTARKIIATLKPIEAARAAVARGGRSEPAQVHSVSSARDDESDEGVFRPINRAERRRHERLAAAASRKSDSPASRPGAQRARDGPAGPRA